MRNLDVLAQQASPETVELAQRLLEQDIANRAWSTQVGAALTQRDTARLLGKSEQAVAKDPRLLRVRSGSGRPAYPVLQFSGRQQLPGVGRVVLALADALEPLSVASWLTAPNRELGRRRPLEALRDGAAHEVEAVVLAAGRLAQAAS